MVYFDNAATGGFKISSVTFTSDRVLRFLLANPGRSGHRLSVRGAELVYHARETLADFFGAPDVTRVAFTKNCTEALNLAIFGTLNRGDHAITTVFDHNAVLRPLYRLKTERDVDYTAVSPDNNGAFLPAVKEAVKPNTRLIVMTGASNVTGALTDYEDVAAFAKDNGILFLLDAAQVAGHVPVDMQKCGITMLATAGHKGLGGIMGSGALVFLPEVDVRPLTVGGTGTETFSLAQPACYPERLESGTLNLPAIAALGEAVAYLKDEVKKIGALLTSRTEYLINELSALGLPVYSKPNPCGIVAFNLFNKTSEETAGLLDASYDIAVRGGFHCAPLMHRYLNTQDGGAVRASLAPQNTAGELRYFCKAVRELAAVEKDGK